MRVRCPERAAWRISSPGCPPAQTGPGGSGRRRARAVGASWRALVIDDNPSAREVLEHMGQSLGWHMDLATSGEQALHMLQQRSAQGIFYQAIFVDWNMPHMDGFTVAELIKESPTLARATIMMLTSGSHPKDAARCRELGIASYLTKPIKQSDLLNAIVTALYSTSVPTRASSLSPLSALPKSPYVLRILLVEDNPINRRLAVLMLEKWGHSVVVATNGREALSALAREPFALVLMDVQMPEMDGFEASRRINAQWPATKRPRIVAMTANAMQGDREMCLAAGMDDYLTKPIRVDALVGALQRTPARGASP